MSSFQRRIAAITNTAANLIGQLRELDRLRDQVWKAQLRAQSSRRINRRIGQKNKARLEKECERQHDKPSHK